MAVQAGAQGNRSVVIGRDAINTIIITGDHSQVFTGEYERLCEAYIEPWSVFERVKLDHFVGREWLLAKIDSFLRDHDRGYFILEADAGLGKTTFLAWLTRERSYIHHFAELAPGLEGIGRSLKSLAAQLVLAYHLSAYEVEGVLPGTATRPDYLHKLLKQAADQRRDEEKIVLVVDAVDEAGTPQGQNVLGLPSILPEGVYIIISQRPVPVRLQVETSSTPRCPFRLLASSGDNQTDMYRFLERVATWRAIVQALQDNGYTSEQFITTLMEKCHGVWIYLHYVVHDIVHKIKRNERSPLDLRSLPDGMTQYYARYWSRWRDEDEDQWDQTWLPLLTMLAAAQEAVPIERLAAWTNVKMPVRRLRRLLNERWRPFLTVSEHGQHARYRFYHATLREFFDGRAEREKLTEAEASLVAELAEATQEAHSRLAEHYLIAWGGLEAGLPGLAQSAQRDMDDGYGLRHLTAHLEASGRIKDLHRLLSLETNKHRNAWYEAQDANGNTMGFLTDIDRAWRLAEAADAEGQMFLPLSLQCRYALLTASVNSLATNIPPHLLAALVDKEVWTLTKGLTHARQVHSPSHRTLALMAMLRYLPPDVRELVLTEVQAAANTIESAEDRARALTTLLRHVPEGSASTRELVINQALDATREIIGLDAQGEVLADIVPYLSQPALANALQVVHQTHNAYWRAKNLITLIPRLPRFEREQCISQALAVACKIEDPDEHAAVQATLAPHLPPPTLANVLQTVCAIKDGICRSETLAALAPYLPISLLQEALDIVRELPEQVSSPIHTVMPKAEALAALALYLPAALLPKALDTAYAIEQAGDRVPALRALALQIARLGDPHRALEVARTIELGYDWLDAQSALAPYLPVPLLQDVLDQVQMIWDDFDKEDTLVELAAKLAEKGDLQEAFVIARTLIHRQQKVLTALAPYLNGIMLPEALDIAHAIEDANSRAKALVALIPLVPANMLSEVEAAIRSIEADYEQADALAALALRMLHLGIPEQALDLVRTVEPAHKRGDILIKLIPQLPISEREVFLVEALTAVKTAKSKFLQARYLEDLAPYLSHLVIDQALEIARALPKKVRTGRSPLSPTGAEHRLRIEVLAAFAAYLPVPIISPEIEKVARVIQSGYFLDQEIIVRIILRLAELGHPRKALKVVRSVEPSSFRAKPLLALVPSLSGSLLLDALATARSIENLNGRAEALAGFGSYLPPDEGGLVFGEALETARAVKNLDHRVQALAGVARYLPASAREQVLAEALTLACAFKGVDTSAVRGLMDTSRAHLLEVLVQSLMKLPSPALARLWIGQTENTHLLRPLSQRTRAYLLMDLAALAPVIAAIGGAETITEIIRAIKDVFRWFP